jgi:ribonuclease E
MPANKKPGGAPKNAVRSALVTAATIATLMGAQTLAFSQAVKDSQQQPAVVISATALQSTQGSADSVTATNQPVVLPTLLPSQTPTKASTPTSTAVAPPPKSATQASASPTSVASSTPAATATKVVTATPTQQTAKVVTAVQQPAPRTRSSRP